MQHDLSRNDFSRQVDDLQTSSAHHGVRRMCFTLYASIYGIIDRRSRPFAPKLPSVPPLNHQPAATPHFCLKAVVEMMRDNVPKLLNGRVAPAGIQTGTRLTNAHGYDNTHGRYPTRPKGVHPPRTGVFIIGVQL